MGGVALINKDREAGCVIRSGIVRVALHGRRVRGWVVADNVASEVDSAALRPLLAVASVGPPESVVTALWRGVAP